MVSFDKCLVVCATKWNTQMALQGAGPDLAPDFIPIPRYNLNQRESSLIPPSFQVSFRVYRQK